MGDDLDIRKLLIRWDLLNLPQIFLPPTPIANPTVLLPNLQVGDLAHLQVFLQTDPLLRNDAERYDGEKQKNFPLILSHKRQIILIAV